MTAAERTQLLRRVEIELGAAKRDARNAKLRVRNLAAIRQAVIDLRPEEAQGGRTEQAS